MTENENYKLIFQTNKDILHKERSQLQNLLTKEIVQNEEFLEHISSMTTQIKLLTQKLKEAQEEIKSHKS